MPPVTYWFEGASRENKAPGNTGGVEWVEDLPDYDPPFSYFYYMGETGGDYVFNGGSGEYEPAPGGPGTGTHNFFQYEGCGDAGYSDDGKPLYFKRVWQPFPGDYVDDEPTYKWFYVPISCDPFIKNNRFTGPGFKGLGSGLGHVNSNIHNELKSKYAVQLFQGNMAALDASLKRTGMKVD